MNSESLYTLIVNQARRTPERIALADDNEHITYYELLSRTESMADLIHKSYGIIEGDFVALVLDKSVLMMVSILAVIKCKGVFVPIAPDHPSARQQQIIDECAPKLVIATDQQVTEMLKSQKIPTIGREPVAISIYDFHHYDQAQNRDSLVYCMFTSGSTGRPKGVLIRDSSVVNLSLWLKSVIYDSGYKIAGLVAPYTFDASIQQIFAPLISGSTLVLINDKLKLNPSLYLDRLKMNGVNVLDITPSYLSVLLSEMEIEQGRSPMEFVLVGGEELSVDLGNRFAKIFGEHCTLINVYGVTEACVNTTFQIVSNNRAPQTVGMPIPGNEISIRDDHFNELPLGKVGEVFISGVGLGVGYLNNPVETGNKFVCLDFKRYYRTGDLGCMLSDAELQILGRNDEQVKIRGHRVEFGEIRKALLNVPGVNDAVISVVKGSTSNDLIAYVVTENSFISNDIFPYMKNALPPYMIPSKLYLIDKIPLTINGKVDHSALRDYEVNMIREQDISYEDEIEKIVFEKYCGALETERIGINDNFFETGGNSLKLILLYKDLNNSFPGLLDVNELFSNPSVKTLSSLIRSKQQANVISTPGINTIDF